MRVHPIVIQYIYILTRVSNSYNQSIKCLFYIQNDEVSNLLNPRKSYSLFENWVKFIRTNIFGFLLFSPKYFNFKCSSISKLGGNQLPLSGNFPDGNLPTVAIFPVAIFPQWQNSQSGNLPSSNLPSSNLSRTHSITVMVYYQRKESLWWCTIREKNHCDDELSLY